MKKLVQKLLPHASTSSSIHPKYRGDIDGLRGLQILALIGFHGFSTIVPGGYVGVDIFFVISGFLISSIIFKSLQKGGFDFLDFYIRRTKRIFPSLITILVAAFAIGWFCLLPDEFKQLGKHIFGGALFIDNFFYWQESGYFDRSVELKPLLHLWSLGIEEQFYLFWPFLLYTAWKRKFNLLTVTLVVISLSFGLNAYLAFANKAQAFDFYLPFTRLWGILAGAVLAYFSIHHETSITQYKQSTKHLFGLIGFALILYAVFYFDRSIYYPGIYSAVPVAGAVLLILAGQQSWINQYVLSNKIMIWFGLISYPLYLWHWMLLSYTRILESAEPDVEIRIVAVLVAILLSWLNYHLIENPIRFSKNNKVTIRALILALALSGAVGAYIYLQNGIPQRSFIKSGSLVSFEVPFRESCTPLSNSNYSDDWCHLSDGGQNDRLLIIGDSHSNALSSVFTELKRSENVEFTQIGRGECPMLLGYGYPQCQELAQQAFNFAKDRQSIKTVLLASRWSIYENGFTREGHTNTRAQFEGALKETISAYRAIGKKVTLVLTVPISNNPRACVVRSVQLSGKNINYCYISLQHAKNFDGHYRDLIRSLESSMPNQFSVLDTWDYLCNQTECKIIDDNEVLYSDEGHLSIYGGKFIARSGKTQLLQLLNP